MTTNFDEAVKHAKSLIEMLYLDYLSDDKPVRYCHPNLSKYSDIDKAKNDDKFSLDFFTDREVYLRSGNRRIKLFEHDCLENENLVNFAMKDGYLFDDLKMQIAFEMHHGYSLAPIIQKFVADILGGDIQSPKKTKIKDIEKKYVFLLAADQAKNLYKLKLTRNDFSPPISALDAVSEALSLLEMKGTYATLKSEVYPLKSNSDFLKYYDSILRDWGYDGEKIHKI